MKKFKSFWLNLFSFADEALAKYSQFRHVDAVSICDLAMYNYIEVSLGGNIENKKN